MGRVLSKRDVSEAKVVMVAWGKVIRRRYPMKFFKSDGLMLNHYWETWL